MTGDEQLDRTGGSKTAQGMASSRTLAWRECCRALPSGFSLREPLPQGARGVLYGAPAGPTEEGAGGGQPRAPQPPPGTLGPRPSSL